MIEIALSSDVSATEKAKIEAFTKHLDGWQGQFSEESVSASVYSFTMLYFL
jgi:hypothetical protein